MSFSNRAYSVLLLCFHLLLSGVVLGQCDPISISGKKSICEGDSTILSAVGPYDNFIWSTGETGPIITVKSSGTYSVQGSSLSDGKNMVLNGDFEQGVKDFTTEYIYDAVYLYDCGIYSISNNAKNVHYGYFPCADNTSGTGNMFIGNGAAVYNQKVWCQTLAVEPKSEYQISASLGSAYLYSPAELQFTVNNKTLGASFTADESECNWKKFVEEWESKSETSAELCLVTINTSSMGNDFILDDISFQKKDICVATNSITVTVNKNPICNLGNDISICNNQSIAIGLPSNDPNLKYLWSNSKITNSIDVSDEGTYSLTLTDANGCKANDDIKVSKSSASISISGNTSFCEGKSTTLSASGDFDNYLWNTGETTPTITVNSAGKYSVKGSHSFEGANKVLNGDFEKGNTDFVSECRYNETTTFYPEGLYYVVDDPQSIAPAYSACADHTSGFGNMLFVNGPTIENTKIWCQNISVKPNTTYHLSASIGSAYYSNPSELYFTINGNTVGSTFKANSSTCVWERADEYWQSSTVTSADVCILNKSIDYGGNDFILDDISFISTDSCTAEASATVVVHENPTVKLGADTIICENQSINLSPVIDDNSLSYLWNNQSTKQTITVDKSGEYILKATNTFNCAAADTIKVAMSFLPQIEPLAETDFCSDFKFAIGHLHNDSQLHYFWNTGDSTNTITITKAGDYLLTMSNANGCSSDTKFEITQSICSSSLYVPSAFSPNGDNKNDVFKVEQENISDYHLLIFNKWGQLIYESNNAEEGWNGNFNGLRCPDDVYVYKLNCSVKQKSGINKQKQLIGHVTLIR